MKKRWIHAIRRDIGKFFCISRVSKSVFAIHFKLINISKGLVSEGKCSSVDICMETNFTKKAAAPYRKTLSTTPKSGKSLPEKESFSVSSEPSKTPEAASDNSVIPLNLLALQIKCGLFVHFFATFETLS